MPADLRATAEAVYAAEKGKISRWYTSPENAQLRVDHATTGLVYTEARSRRDFGDSPTGGSVDVAAALKSIKSAMKVHSLLLPDAADRVGQIGVHLKNAFKALGGALTSGGGLDDSHAGDDKTQLPSRSRRLEKLAHAEAQIMRTDPNSKAARRLKCEWALEDIRADLARDDARIQKDNHRQRWEMKDDYLTRPPWWSLELYPRKPKAKQPTKDPWVL